MVLSDEESGVPPPQPSSLGGGGVVGGVGGIAVSYPTLDNNNNINGNSSGSGSQGGLLPFQIDTTIPTHCPSSTTNTINVGYYQSWAKYRSPHCHSQRASEIPVKEFGYTHLIYSFAGISSTGGILEPYNGVMEEVAIYEEFNRLKTTTNNNGGGLVTLIAVGGWNLDQTLFTHISSTPTTRQTFATSVVTFLQTYNFDGLDLDWEYPVTRQGSPSDYDNYPLLVQSIRSALDAATLSSGKEYLLTMAIPVNPTKLDTGYNLMELANYVDWFHLMSYDIYGSWDDIAGSNTDMEYIANTVENNILKRGVGGDQLVFGMASYGRSMKLTNSSGSSGGDSCKTTGCPINGAGLEGCSGELGFSPLFELQETYVNTGQYSSLLINERTMSMEMIVGGDNDVFVSLDLDVTFRMKREYYLSKCFRGQMWWAVDMIKDPPFGTTSNTNTNNQASTSNQAPTPAAAVVASPPNLSLNSAPGVTQDDAYCSTTNSATLMPIADCTGFVFCQNGKMSGSITMCSTGLLFDANMGICNWPSETNICGFEFCPDKAFSGWVPFEECSKFYYCKAGSIDGDIDVCPGGTLFDVELGICNWASMVVCRTGQPTPSPTHPLTPRPTFGSVSLPAVGVQYDTGLAAPPPTPKPTYGTIGGGGAGAAVAANKSDPTASDHPIIPEHNNIAVIANSRADGTNPSAFQDNIARLRFFPTDDAYVQESMPYKNFNERFIVVDEDLRFDGLLRFYVQGLDHRRVKYVKLRLYVSNQSTFGGNFYKSKHTWHEDVVTWDGAPSIIGQKPLAVVNHGVVKDEWMEVDITGLIQGNKDGPVSVRITSDSSDNVMYCSKEHPNKNGPELIVGVEADVNNGGDDSSAGGDDIEAKEKKDAPMTMNTFKIGPTDDAYIFEPNGANAFAMGGAKNYGHESNLKVDMDGGIKTSYLRFDLSRVRVKALESATLRLYATDSSAFGGTFVTSSSSDWDEDTITHKNAPPADGTVLGALENVSEGNWYELDVTKAMTESRPLTICILASHDDHVVYSSKDDGSHNGPEIILTLQESIPLVSQGGEVVELVPTDDATIVLQAPNSNFGKSEELKTDANEGMHNFLLRFDATDIPRGEVKSAILRIYAENEEPAFGGTFVETTDTDWNDRTVTWDNAPSANGQVLGSLMEVEYGSWYDVDVTTAVIGGSPVGFRVSSPHSSVATYGSKESGNHQPRLIVQYSPPQPLPEDFDIYIPTDDASILMDDGDANFGRGDQLKVDGYGGVYNSLLRFDLSSVEKGTVEQAILRLYARDGSPSGGTLVTTRNTEWSQYTVTWNTAPPADGTILKTLKEVVPYQWYEIDLVDIVPDLGGEALSIRISPSHGMRCAYSSSQDRLGHLPQLMIKADMFKGME
ncbi:hypothetical protein ACHAXR_008953 [Thalassiosira sp. AJA248-18]